MEALTEFFSTISYWHWLALAAILIILEIVTPTTYLLWPGLAAAAVGILSAISGGLGGDVELLVFAVLAVGATILGRRMATPAGTEALSGLNRRADQYVGRMASAADAFSNGRGPVVLDDTHWQARDVDGANHARGVTLEVLGHEGAILKVRKAAR